MKLEEKLVRLRKEKGLTQMELAEAVEVSRQAVSKWETGGAVPSTEKLRNLCGLYDVTLDELLDEKGEIPAKENNVPEEKAAEKEKPTEAKADKKFRMDPRGIWLSWKWITAILMLAALLSGIGLGVWVERKRADKTIHLWEIPGEKIESIDGTFSFEEWWK